MRHHLRKKRSKFICVVDDGRQQKSECIINHEIVCGGEWLHILLECFYSSNELYFNKKRHMTEVSCAESSLFVVVVVVVVALDSAHAFL